MTFNQAISVVIGSSLVLTWWLSRYDARLIGEARAWDTIRRLFRCVISALLVGAVFWFFWKFFHNGDATNGLIPIPIIIVLSVMWAGAVGELVSGGFSKMFDSDGRRAYDPEKGEAGLRQLALLVEAGRNAEAVKLGRKLEKSGDTNILVLEATMQRLGLDERHADRDQSLVAARKLHAEGRFAEAERVLGGVLKRHPDFTDAAILRIRILVQNMGQEEKANEALAVLQKQPGTSPGMLEFARSLLADHEPAAPAPAPTTPVAPVSEPVEVLISQRRFGSAITALKDQVREHPENFTAWSLLAEVYGRHCGSLQQVENIIKLLAVDPHFNPDQIQSLRSQLEEWRKEWRVTRTSEPAPATSPETVK